uniref:Uncharacterized protein n=1 Tax=Bellilinea caldifistulae TaxID=360411 RepID=A0A7C4L3D1_9CHLR
MWWWRAGWSSDQRGRPNGLAYGTVRLAPRHRLTPSGVCALGVAACVRGRSGASVPGAGVAARPKELTSG